MLPRKVKKDPSRKFISQDQQNSSVGSSSAVREVSEASNPSVLSKAESKAKSTVVTAGLQSDGVKCENTRELLKLCGDDGVWQIVIFLLGSLCGINTAIQSFVFQFIAEPNGYWCALPQNLTHNYTHGELKSKLTPKDSSGSFLRCLQYDYKIAENGSLDTNGVKVSCHTNEFTESYGENTIASEWDLVCDRANWLSHVQSVYMFGLLVGSIAFGSITDKLGRSYGIWISSFILCISAPFTALSPNYPTLLLSRFFLGFAATGVYSTSYVLVIEFIGPKHRGLAGVLFAIPSAIGYLVLPIIAYFIRDWRSLQLILAALSSLLILTWWQIPESPRWLLTQGRSEEAENVLRKIARINDRALPENFGNLVRQISAERETKKKSLCQRLHGILIVFARIVRYKKLRLRVLIIAISLFAISMVYYGIAIDAVNLEIDKYLFTFICGVLEIPANLITPPLINTFLGRRITFSCMIMFCGVFLLLSLIFTSGSKIVILLATTAQMLISASSSLVYLYASELFPTEIRAFGLGFVLMIGRIGSVAAPYIVEVLGEENKSYPTIIFGLAALLSGALALLLPETKGKILPETIEDVERS